MDPPPFWRKNLRDRFPDFEGRVDRWQIIHYYAPSTICIDVGVARAGTGAPEDDRRRGVNGYVMNTITPETNRTFGCPRYVLLAGGVGITAVAEMARVLRGVGADYTLVYVGRSRERMAYVDELAELHRDRLLIHVDDEQTALDVAELVGRWTSTGCAASSSSTCADRSG